MNTSVYERAPRVTGAGEPAVESGVSAVSWPAIWAGAVVAAAASVVLVALGSGLGYAAISPWSGTRPETFAISSGIWLLIVQWVASGMGGYVTGRLRTKWAGTHTHEVFFRDTAHGLIPWAVATVIVAGVTLLASVAAAVVGSHGAVTSAVDPDAARKAAAAASIFTALSLVIGAFIACVAAALGGRQRDEHP
jgi:hypothetical protein